MTQPKKRRKTDVVKATPQGIRLLRDRIRDRILREKQRLREEGLTLNYNRHELAYQAGVSFDTIRRFQGGVCIKRDYAEAIARFLELELANIIEPDQSQRPSDYYVNRPPFESECYEALLRPGALIRVKAPHGMGKTWFVEQLLIQRRKDQYQSVTLSFYDADNTVFSSLKTFLKWFCTSVGNSLDRPDQLEERWQQELSDNINCKNYFKTYLLADFNTPLVLVLDDVDLVFEKHEVAGAFCKLLRGWYDEARRDGTWSNLRLVIVHSTNIYGALDINSSPLANVGTVLQLRQFDLAEMSELVHQYQLTWQVDQIKQIMALTGGNPYLIHKALDYLKMHPEIKLERFLQTAAIAIDPYHDHLCDLLITLQQNAGLASVFKDIVSSITPIKIKSDYKFQLDRMGLIKQENEDIAPSCELYRCYFQNHL
jgi:hypothetical protein